MNNEKKSSLEEKKKFFSKLKKKNIMALPFQTKIIFDKLTMPNGNLFTRKEILKQKLIGIERVLLNKNMSSSEKQSLIEEFLTEEKENRFIISKELLLTITRIMTVCKETNCILDRKVVQSIFLNQKIDKMNKVEYKKKSQSALFCEVMFTDLEVNQVSLIFYNSIKEGVRKTMKSMSKDSENSFLESTVSKFEGKHVFLKKIQLVEEISGTFLKQISGFLSVEKKEILLKKSSDGEKTPALKPIREFVLTFITGVLMQTDPFTLKNYWKGKTKSQTFFIFETSKIKDLLPVVEKTLLTPMITRPLDWELKDGKPVQGGFINLRKQGVSLMASEIDLDVGESTIQVMNYLQKTTFKIETKSLDDVIENPVSSILDLMESRKKKVGKKNLDMILVRNGDGVNVLTFDEFCRVSEKYTPNEAKLALENVFLKEKISNNIDFDTFLKRCINLYYFKKKDITKELKDDPLLKILYKIIKTKLFRSFLEQRAIVKKHYDNIIEATFEFFLTVTVCSIYKNEKRLFFPSYIDSRGRCYYFGYPLNPQGNKLVKSLIKLADPCFGKEEDSATKKAFLSGSEGPFLKNLAKIYDSCNKPLRIAIGDVLSSGMQILSILAGDSEGIYSTNVFNVTSTEDLYTHCLSLMKKEKRIFFKDLFCQKENITNSGHGPDVYGKVYEEYKKIPEITDPVFSISYYASVFEKNRSDIYELLNGEKYEQKKKKKGFLEIYFEEDEQEFVHLLHPKINTIQAAMLLAVFHLILNLYLDKMSRKAMKMYVMPFIYSEGDFYRKKRIILETELLLMEESVLLNMIKSLITEEELRLIIIRISVFVNKLFLISLEKSYPSLYSLSINLQKLGKILAKRKEKINSSITFNLKNFSYNYKLKYIFYKTKSEQIKMPLYVEKSTGFIGRKKGGLSHTLQISDDQKIDTAGMGRKICPNFIHQIDALLLHYVVLQCEKNNIELYTAHDCFFTRPECMKFIKKFYFDAIVEVLFMNNPLEQLVSNNLDFPDLTKEELLVKENLLKHSKNSMGFFLSNKHLTMNENILSP